MPNRRFLEHKKFYGGKINEYDCTLVQKGDGTIIVAYSPPAALHFLGVDFPLGSLSLGHFWEGRNYNCYHWKSPSGETLLFYFNISKDTRISADEVEWLDLFVDIALYPDNVFEVLDEDEVPETISASDRSIIERTKIELVENLGSIRKEIEERSRKIQVQ